MKLRAVAAALLLLAAAARAQPAGPDAAKKSPADNDAAKKSPADNDAAKKSPAENDAAKKSPAENAANDPVRIRGAISERGTRTPLAGVAVIATDAAGSELTHAESDERGAFALRLPARFAGALKLVLASPDHKPLRTDEKLAAGEALTVNYALQRASYVRYESTVRGAPPREEIARVSLDAEEIQRIPGTHGDALQAVLNLPSVARSPFDLGQLVIRGSQPGESGAFLAGMQIPQAFHFGGLTATFNSFLLERFDLIPSNFSVRYGRLVGGVVDIVPRDPKRDRLHGDVKVDLFDAHAILEGPIGKGAFALSFRRSYADAILAAVVPVDTITVAPRYYDYQAMLDYPVGPGKLKLIAFGSDDAFALVNKTPPDADPSLAGQFSTHDYFHTLIASYKTSNRELEREYKVQVGFQHADADLGSAARFNLDLIEMDARLEWSWRPMARVKLTGGLDLQTDYFWVYVDAPHITTEEKPQGPLATQAHTQLSNSGFEAYPALYAQVEWRPLERLTLVPGVRVDWFAHKSGTYVQPRVQARWRVARDTFLKAAVGLYHQPPQAPYDDAVLGNPRIHPEQAWHFTVGVEARPLVRWRALFVDVNLFYKDLRYLAVSSDQLVQRGSQVVPEIYSDEGIGRVYGGDLLIKQDSPRFIYGWVSYTLLKSERQDHPGLGWRPFQYDQTQILTIVAGYHLPWDIDLGTRFRYVTGNPDTPILAGIYDADRDAWIPITGAPFSTRLPDFIQLDVRVDKRFIFKKWILAAYIDITNVTNRGNTEGFAYSYDFQRRVAVQGLPILPSIGLRASF